jgi:hypothetical protein
MTRKLTVPPVGDEPERANRATGNIQNENTTESTTYATMFAECMRQYLEDEQLQELMQHLGVPLGWK